jgi:hypothetical protein
MKMKALCKQVHTSLATLYNILNWEIIIILTLLNKCTIKP